MIYVVLDVGFVDKSIILAKPAGQDTRVKLTPSYKYVLAPVPNLTGDASSLKPA